MSVGFEDTLREVHRLLRGEVEAADAAGRLGADEARLRIYQRFVEGHVREVLTKNYETFPSLLGTERWDHLAGEFFRQVPPRDYELNACVASFPGFLEARLQHDPELSPALVDLAHLEWTEFSVWASEAEIPRPEEVEGPTLNPTLEILRLEYPVAAFLAAWRRGEEPSLPTAPAGETVLVFREPRTLTHAFHVADDSLLFALKVSHDRLDLDAAAVEAGASLELAREALQRAAEVGLVVLPREISKGLRP